MANAGRRLSLRARQERHGVWTPSRHAAVKLWAYLWMIAVLLAFIGYQVYLIVLSPTIALIALTVIDILIVLLTWLEYQRQ